VGQRVNADSHRDCPVNAGEKVHRRAGVKMHHGRIVKPAADAGHSSRADKGHVLPEFYSGATGLPGRFSVFVWVSVLPSIPSRWTSFSMTVLPSCPPPCGSWFRGDRRRGSRRNGRRGCRAGDGRRRRRGNYHSARRCWRRGRVDLRGRLLGLRRAPRPPFAEGARSSGLRSRGVVDP
jgi:hypothetical protein